MHLVHTLLQLGKISGDGAWDAFVFPHECVPLLFGGKLTPWFVPNQ
jgi:hypothetical protein